MRKLIYQVWLSLDGFAAHTDNTTKFFESPELAAGSDQDIAADMDQIDTILIGANTYKMFVNFWPTAAAEEEIMSEKINSTPKIVFSKSLTEAPWGKWPSATIVNTDPAATVKKMKAENGKSIVIWGSLSIARLLMTENLIDEYHIRICPIILGDGIRLFEKGKEKKLNLFQTKHYPSGLMLLKYKPI